MVTASNNDDNNDKKNTSNDKKKTVKDKNKIGSQKDKKKKEDDNKKKDTEKDKKATKNKTKSSNSNKKKDENKGGPVDEKGNPFPIDNPDGGDPICPGGYKIDYDFDPFNDPINPPFRCISALADPNDGAAGKALQMANNPSSGVANSTTGEIPSFGGRVNRSRRKYRKKTRKLYYSHRRSSHRRKRY
jgi:hypothetical protein